MVSCNFVADKVKFLPFAFRHKGHKYWYFVEEEDGFEEVEEGVSFCKRHIGCIPNTKIFEDAYGDFLTRRASL